MCADMSVCLMNASKRGVHFWLVVYTTHYLGNRPIKTAIGLGLSTHSNGAIIDFVTKILYYVQDYD